MADLNEVTAKVQRILAKHWRVELTESGGFFLRLESTGCGINCYQDPDDGDDSPVFVRVSAAILFDVPVTNDLFRWVATEGADYRFGNAHLYLDESETTAQLFFSHTLLGDYLDAEELNYAVAAVGFTADRLDDELLSLFGGRRAADPPD
jgi:hypothetical protein